MSNSNVSQSSPTASQHTSQYQRTEQSVYEDTEDVQQNPTLDILESSDWNEVRVDDHDYQLLETYLDDQELPLSIPNDANSFAGTPTQDPLQFQELTSQRMTLSHTIRPSTFTQSSLYGSHFHGSVPAAREDVLNFVGETLHPAEDTPGHRQSGDDSFQILGFDMSVNTPFPFPFPFPFPSQPIPQEPQESSPPIDTPSALLARDHVKLAKEFPELDPVIEKSIDPLLEFYVSTGTIDPTLLALPIKILHLQVPPPLRGKDRDSGRYGPYRSIKRHCREYVPTKSVKESSSNVEREHNTIPKEDNHPRRTRFRPSAETETHMNSGFQHTESNEGKSSGYNSVEHSTSRRSSPEHARSGNNAPRRERGGRASKDSGSFSDSTTKRGRTASDGSATQPPVLAAFDDEMTMAARPQRRRGADSLPLRPRAVVPRLDFVTKEVMTQGKQTDLRNRQRS